jgi:hypothetical protein
MKNEALAALDDFSSYRERHLSNYYYYKDFEYMEELT